jgi:hypothetical protein
MLIVLAANSISTRTSITGRGKDSAILAASPWPVTRPIRAATDWTAAISG